MNPTGLSQFDQARVEWAIRLRYSPMPKLDPETVARQLNEFRIGELRTVGKTWEIMMERSAELMVNADKRYSDLAGLAWRVVSDGSPDGDTHAAALDYFYNHIRVTHALDQDKTGGMSQLLYDMASAHSHYYSAHEMLLRVDNPAAREVTAEFRHTPVWFFESRRGYLGYLQHIFDMYGQPCIQGEWLTCVGNGWMRPLSLAFCTEMFTLRDWQVWCSRFAGGFLEGVVDETPGTDAWNEAVEAVETLASTGAVVHSPKVILKFLEQAGRTGLPFSELMQLVHGLYAKAYRGVDLATGSRLGSSGGNGAGSGKNPVGASVQKEESGIFLSRDAMWATGYLNERVDRPIIRYLFNQEPRAWMAVMPPLDDTSDSDLQFLQAVVPMGIRIAQQDVYERFKWDAPAAGEPCLEAPIQQNPDSTGGNGENGENAAQKPPLTPLPPVKSPASSDTAEEQTQPAQEAQDAPIGAGANPRAIAQIANPNMPNPQVRAGSMMSQAVKALNRSASSFYKGKGPSTDGSGKNPGPAFGYAIANQNSEARIQKPGEIPGEFEQVAREQFADAVRDDLSHVATQIDALLQIDDPDHFKTKADQLRQKMSQLTINTLLAPKAADALMPIIGTSFANGVKDDGKALANWDPDQPRDSMGRWIDENGGGLSMDDNIKRGNKAMDRAIRQKTDVQKAMHRKEVGQIDFKWGTPGETANDYAGGHGVSHIIAKHGESDARAMPQVLAKGRIMPHAESADKKLVEHGNYVASLARKNSRSAFVLTGFRRKLG